MSLCSVLAISISEVMKVSFTTLSVITSLELPAMPSPPLLQVMLGRWMPLAEQVRVILPPITTSRLARGVVTVGGTERRENEREKENEKQLLTENSSI